jgi:hypothetical protein
MQTQTCTHAANLTFKSIGPGFSTKSNVSAGANSKLKLKRGNFTGGLELSDATLCQPKTFKDLCATGA